MRAASNAIQGIEPQRGVDEGAVDVIDGREDVRVPLREHRADPGYERVATDRVIGGVDHAVGGVNHATTLPRRRTLQGYCLEIRG